MSKRRRSAAPELPPLGAPVNDIAAARARADAAVASLETRTDAEIQILKLEQRLDRWVNHQTGLGTLDDKTRASRFEYPWRLSDQEITALASGNDLAAKCIEKRPDEMFRRGYALEGQQPGAIDKSQIDDVQQYANETLLADVRMQEGMQYGRQYGGSILILGINDGGDPWDPVDEDAIESIDFINQVDRRFAYVQSYYSDYQRPMFGQAETYLVANGVATSSYRSADGSTFGYRKKTAAQIKRASPQASILNIHESRIIRFDGIMPDLITRQTLAGWSWSVLQRPYEILRLLDGSFDALGYLLSDASQGVLKLKGLFNAISAGKEQKLQQRMEMMEKTRSVMRSIALDAGGEEDFTRISTPLTGIPESIDRIMQRLAAAMDMPVTELFGISPAGLNATGESDRIKWYDTVATEQSKYLAPKIKRLYKLLSLAKSGPFKGKGADFKVKFHPLYSPTDDELAGTRLKNAQRDEIYVTMEAVTAEQVSLTLTEVYPSINADEIEQEVEAKTAFDPYANDPNESATAQAAAGGANGSLPEQQSPTVPLPGSQLHGVAGAPAGEGRGTPSGPKTGNPSGSAKVPEGAAAPTPQAQAIKAGAQAPPAKKRDWHFDSKNIADAVHDQLAEDFPVDKLGWVKAAKWRGPVRVPLESIDFSGKAKWAASHDHVKVAMHKERMEQGLQKPVILVKTPGKNTLDIIDGHHRGLAAQELGKSPRAYVATVHSDKGPWDELHAAQRDGEWESSAQKTGADRKDPPFARRDYSPDQPRDEQGRFGEGGGSSSAPKPTGRTFTSTPPRGSSGDTTRDHYHNGAVDPDRKAAVHDPIVRAALDHVEQPPEGAPKIAYFTMGGPGSGKSSALRGIDKSKFVQVDPDAVKEQLPEYKAATSDPTATFRGAAAMVHTESSDIASRIRREAIAQGKNIIVDGTGSNADALIAKMREAKAAGYDVHLSYAHLGDTQEAIRRVNARAEETGRAVPEGFIKDAYEKIPRNFEKVAAEAHTFDVRDSSRPGSPVVWEKGDDGLERRSDPAFVASFKAQYSSSRDREASAHAPPPIREAPAGEFKASFDKAFEGSPFTNHVSHYSEPELKGMKTFVTADGKAGVAVHDHGDGRVEATALFNQGGAKGAGLDLLRNAVKTQGVNYVECYGDGLRHLYEKVGFKVDTSLSIPSTPRLAGTMTSSASRLTTR